MYWVPLEVFIARTDDGFIWFDVREDGYFGTGAQVTESALVAIQGQTERDQDNDTRDLLADLLTRRLLTTSPEHAKPFCLTNAKRPVATLIPEGTQQTSQSPWLQIPKFLLSHALTWYTLKVRSLYYALHSVSRLKPEGWPPHETKSHSAIADLVRIFLKIEPSMFTGAEQCLQRSIRLAFFLKMNGVYPDLLIGVASPPFRAHCWLQIEETALNSELDYTQQFTPILKC